MGNDAKHVEPSQIHETVLQLLEQVCGSREVGDSMLRHALIRGRLAALSERPAEALTFVRAHLLGPLSAEMGPRLAMAFVDELVERMARLSKREPVVFAPSSLEHRRTRPAARTIRSPPTGVLVLVDPNWFRRASLARVLVRAGWNVRTAQSEEQVLEAAGREERPNALVVELDHPRVEAIVRQGSRAAA